MQRLWQRLRQNQRGATAIEYGLMVAIVGIGLLLSAEFLGDESLELWTAIDSRVSSAAP